MGYIPVGSGGETKYDIIMSHILFFIFLVAPPILFICLIIAALYHAVLEII